MKRELTLEAFKHDAIQNGANYSVVLVAIVVVALLFYFKKWKWLWKEWLTSLDPKKIGVMYLVVILFMLLKGLGDAALMRVQQALSVGNSHGILSADHFQQIFSAHGTTMIFFVGMGVVFGVMNLVIPLQIGARDVAFPFLNSLGFWLFCSAGTLTYVSLAIGDFSIAGWLAYPPLSELEYSPGSGVDYWIWILQIAGVGSLISGINFLVTIIKMRCPGMTLMKMPIFVWSALGAVILVIFAFPILTVTLALLSLDRYLGMHFFTSIGGGNPMMYVNLIWAWGHPEVYILILPAFGVFSEVVSTFSQKRLFGYVSMVWAIVSIVVLSFIVWLHHFFTMGASPKVNAFFGIMTMLIAVPTGVKMFNWLFTQYRGRILFKVPMLWFFGFSIIFTVGGMAGILLSIPAIDFQTHNSLFLIAHFHSVIIGGVLFGLFSGYTYWFPKIFGFRLQERLGKYAFWCWFTGFLTAFMPLYLLGFMGATRRLNHYEAETGWNPLFIVAGIGLLLIVCGITLHIAQLALSIKRHHALKDTTGDPWNARNLEWSTTSPPPFYNFATIPQVKDLDPYWTMKQGGIKEVNQSTYQDIHMPKDTPVGLYIGILCLILGFALTWHMFILAGLCFLGVIVCLIARLSVEDIYYYVPAAEVEKIEIESKKRREKLA